MKKKEESLEQIEVFKYFIYFCDDHHQFCSWEFLKNMQNPLLPIIYHQFYNIKQ